MRQIVRNWETEREKVEGQGGGTLPPRTRRWSSSLEGAGLNRPGEEVRQDGGRADGQVRGGEGEERERLVTGSTKVLIYCNKINSFVRGEKCNFTEIRSHRRTDSCTDEAATNKLLMGKATGSNRNDSNAIYQTDDCGECNGGGKTTARRTK